nr:hypothetical protein [Tanacetum cinerariifolium]
MITEAVRIRTDQQHGLDYMEKIIVMRENDKPDSYPEADFKYLNKSDIEDLCYRCLNKKVNVRKNKLKNSLITSIRSCVIWERVHDFQLGIESYQIKVLRRSSSIFTSVYVAVQKLKKTLARALVNLVNNSKLNNVGLLLEAEMKCFTSRRFTRREKDCFMSKRIKRISLGKILLELVLVTESAGSLNDATVYADVSTKAPNTTSPTINVVNLESTSPNQNGGDKVGNESANVPNDVDYGVWLPLALVDEVKFHDVPLVAHTLDGLNLMATKIGTPVMLDSYTNSMCLESWERSSYARILIEIKACNELSDLMVMAVPNLELSGYTKETIRIEYEWKPPRYSTCLIFGHSRVDCPKERVANKKDKCKGQTSGANDEGFIEVKKNKSGGNNGGTKNFTVSVKPKTQYRLTAKQSSEGTSLPKTTPFVGTSKTSTLGYNKESSSNKGNTFSLSNSFAALNGENLIIEEVSSVSMATTLGTQEEVQSSTPIVDKINVLENNWKKVDYLGDLGSGDEVEPVDNEMTTFWASKPTGIGYGLKSLLEQ